MRFIVDVETAHGKSEITINAATPSTRGEHNQLVDSEEIGSAIGTVIDRILSKQESVVLPEEMRNVDVMIEWCATSVVQIPILKSIEDPAQLREAVRQAIKRDGLPEVVVNPTIEFAFPCCGYLPSKPGEFDTTPGNEIEIE